MSLCNNDTLGDLSDLVLISQIFLIWEALGPFLAAIRSVVKRELEVIGEVGVANVLIKFQWRNHGVEVRTIKRHNRVSVLGRQSNTVWT